MNGNGADLIVNRGRVAGTLARDLALDCVAADVRTADSVRGIHDAVTLDGGTLVTDGDEYDLAAFVRVVVLGGGNAAGRAAEATRHPRQSY